VALASGYATEPFNLDFEVDVEQEGFEEVLFLALFTRGSDAAAQMENGTIGALSAASVANQIGSHLDFVAISVLAVVLLVVFCIPARCWVGRVRPVYDVVGNQLSKFDRAKHTTVNSSSMHLEEHGTSWGGILALWSYGIILLAIGFGIWYSTSFVPCRTSATTSVDSARLFDLAGAINNTAAPVVDTVSTCHSTARHNINRFSSLNGFASADQYSNEVLNKLWRDQPLNITLVLFGYADLRTGMSMLESSSQLCGAVQLQTPACFYSPSLGAPVAQCSAGMQCSVDAHTDGAVLLQYSLPALRVGAPFTTSVQVVLPRFVLVTNVAVAVTAGALANVPIQSAQPSSTSFAASSFNVLSTGVRIVPPMEQRHGTIQSVTVTASMLSTVRKTATSGLAGFVSLSSQQAVINPFPTSIVPQSSGTTVTVKLQQAEAFQLQTEDVKIAQIELLFTLGLGIIALYELTEFVIHAVHLAQDALHALQLRRTGTKTHSPPVVQAPQQWSVPLLVHDKSADHAL
jgi:hypothetical protein